MPAASHAMRPLLVAAGLALGCGDDLPTICEGDSDPEQVVDTFWGTLDAEYALFDIRLGEDHEATWAALGRTACADVTAGGGDDVLFDALLTMAEALDDGHVQIESPTRDEDGWVSVYPHIEAMAELRANVSAQYASALDEGALGQQAWGRLEGTTAGYWDLRAMDELTAEDDEDADIAEAERVASLVTTQLADVECLIVDVRNNEGGWDLVSLAIARHFAGPATLVWQKASRDGEGHTEFSAFGDVGVAASESAAFEGPAVLLTSGATFSAGETFVLAMRERTNVTVLGEPTSGHFSDLYDGELPNDWDFTFSGDRYRAADGEIYEGRGVPVDVPVAFDPAAFASGQDVMLEAALAECP